MNKKYTKTLRKGIWKNNNAGTYSARKTINGKKHSKSFKSLKDAINWRALFNGYSNLKDGESKENIQLNGNCSLIFENVWTTYLSYQENRISLPSFQKLKVIYKSFDEELTSSEIRTITNASITGYITRSKFNPSPKRYTFNQELKKLKAFFNFINMTIDSSFSNPVNKLHFEMGIVQKSTDRKTKRKVLTAREVNHLFSILPTPYRTIAEVQFCTGGRISEVIALNKKNVCFETDTITVKDVAQICYHTKKVIGIKEHTKNGDIRKCSLATTAKESLRKLKPNTEGYFFHNNGNFLTYRQVQNEYDKAFKLMGIYKDVSGTHVLRHTSASIVRNSLSIDHTAAITGHKDIRMAQHYGKLSVSEKNKESVDVLNKILKETTLNYPND